MFIHNFQRMGSHMNRITTTIEPYHSLFYYEAHDKLEIYL